VNMNMNKKMALVALGALVLVALTVVFGMRKWQQAAPARPVLRVGMMSGWAPFMSVDGAGEAEGFDVDVAREIARRMGCEPEIVDLGSLPALLLALNQGTIDMAMSGLDSTPERQKTFEMVRYTGEDMRTLALVFWKEVPVGVATVADLQKIPGAVIAVESGSSQEVFANTLQGLAKKPLACVTDMFLDVQYGRSTAMLLEPRIARRYQKQKPELVSIMVPLPAQFQVAGCGIALRKQDARLASQLEQVVGQMRQDGTLKRLEQQWQLED